LKRESLLQSSPIAKPADFDMQQTG